MCSKSDFLSWDDSDINLDLLLGEYTGSDIDSDSENPPPKRAKKDTAKFIYKCPECDSTYSSVSGFRGHLRKKHSLTSIKSKYSFFLIHQYFSSKNEKKSPNTITGNDYILYKSKLEISEKM